VKYAFDISIYQYRYSQKRQLHAAARFCNRRLFGRAAFLRLQEIGEDSNAKRPAQFFKNT
jgi:hypothetical protein